MLFSIVKIVKLEELLDNMKTTKGNIPSPGEYVFIREKKAIYFHYLKCCFQMAEKCGNRF